MMKLITEGFARETLLAFQMARDAQRLYDKGHREGMNDSGPYDEDAPWQHSMDAAERMQQAADGMTDDVETRAIAAGVDVADMLRLVDCHFNGGAFNA